MTAHLFTPWGPEYVNPTVGPAAQKNRFLTKRYCLSTRRLLSQELRGAGHQMNVFTPVGTAPELQPRGQGETSTFKS